MEQDAVAVEVPVALEAAVIEEEEAVAEAAVVEAEPEADPILHLAKRLTTNAQEKQAVQVVPKAEENDFTFSLTALYCHLISLFTILAVIKKLTY